MYENYEYKIGTTLEGMTLLTELTTPLKPPAAAFTPSVGSITLGDGTERAIGSALTAWHWGFLTSNQRDQLKEFCPGKSAEVYIRTILADGTYANYSCVMVWPQNENRQSTRVVDITVDFRQMVLIPPEEP